MLDAVLARVVEQNTLKQPCRPCALSKLRLIGADGLPRERAKPDTDVTIRFRRIGLCNDEGELLEGLPQLAVERPNSNLLLARRWNHDLAPAGNCSFANQIPAQGPEQWACRARLRGRVLANATQISDVSHPEH